MENDQIASSNKIKETVKKNLERRIRNREYQRQWRLQHQQKDLKKKVSKEEREVQKRKKHCESQKAYYHRTKDCKRYNKNVDKILSPKKLDDLEKKKKILDYNEDHTNVVQSGASQNLENVQQFEQNQFIYIPGSHHATLPRSMTSTDTYQLKWHSHSAHLNGSVAALLRSERFTDVVLCTMDGSQIPAHKFILSSCSVYLSSLFDGQRSVMRMGGMLYVVLPSEITTKALKILVEYMYKGETTVSNEVLDTVLKAGEVLKIRGLWRQAEDGSDANANSDKAITTSTTTQIANVNKQSIVKKPEEIQAKVGLKKDDKVVKFNPIQNVTQGGVTRPMFIGPPKLVFIKTSEGGTTAALRPGTPLMSKGQTILVAPAPTATEASTLAITTPSSTVSTVNVTTAQDDVEDTPPPRILRRHAVEKKYGKKQKTDTNVEETAKNKEVDADKDNGETSEVNIGKDSPMTTEIQIKDEPDWDAASIEEEERSIAEMFQAEMNVKSEPLDEVDIEEENLIYSPLSCELCAEVFTVPAAWVRHVQGHTDHTTARKRKRRSDSDDTEDSMALLRCDLCQKHFPNPGLWVRHIQSTHTESELALSNNSSPPKRHNRFTEGEQTKTCSQCNKSFPSHASMLIHMRTHTGERPFICGLCNKGFNVKSNLLRHLRTLHDQFIKAVEEEDNPTPGPSEVKREA